MDPYKELRRHPGWWARLRGEALDLQTLSEETQIEGLQIEQFDDRYYLHTAEFEGVAPAKASEIERRASEILRVLNGAARLAHGNSREVHTECAVLVGNDGQVQNFVQMSGTIRARGRLGADLTVQGTVVEREAPRPVVTRAAKAALRDRDIERVLRIIGRDDVDYRDLYYVFEIAQASLGSEMLGSEISQSDLVRFKRTAQSPTVLGDAARHGTEKTSPPAKPMPFGEAEALVHRILRLWLAI